VICFLILSWKLWCYKNVIQQHGSSRALKNFEVSFAIDLKQNPELDLQVLVTTVPAHLF
jgi:hypothetical protein